MNNEQRMDAWRGRAFGPTQKRFKSRHSQTKETMANNVATKKDLIAHTDLDPTSQMKVVARTVQSQNHDPEILIELDEQNLKQSSDDLISLGDPCISAQQVDSIISTIESDIPSDNCLPMVDDVLLFSDGEAEEEAIPSYQHRQTDDEMLSIDEEALRSMNFP